MRKIPTIFERDWDGDRSRVVNAWHKDCVWVRDGEGVATRKIDGASCLIRDAKSFKRREIKKGQTPPPDFELATDDAETGKQVGWVPVGDAAKDGRHRQAFEHLIDRRNGAYELIGPNVQGNPEHAASHTLVAHADCEILDAPREFDALSSWLAGKDIEGLVWRHPDGRMAKIKLRDFGLKRGA